MSDQFDPRYSEDPSTSFRSAQNDTAGRLCGKRDRDDRPPANSQKSGFAGGCPYRPGLTAGRAQAPLWGSPERIRKFVKSSQNIPKKIGATPKKGLTFRCRSCNILNVRREPITPAATDREAGISTPFSSLRAYRKGLAQAVFRRGDSEGAKRCFRAYTRRSCRNFIRNPKPCAESSDMGKVE